MFSFSTAVRSQFTANDFAHKTSRVERMRHDAAKSPLGDTLGDSTRVDAPRILASRETRWFTVVLREDGILAFHPVPGLVLTYEVALQVFEVGMQITECARPTMVLMQDIGRVEREARAYFAGGEYMQLCSQTALVVGSPVSRVIGNFFVGLNRPQYPHKIFDDPELAAQWLREFVP